MASLSLEWSAFGEAPHSRSSPDAFGDTAVTPGGAMQLPGRAVLDDLRGPALPVSVFSKALAGLKPENANTLRGTKSIQLYRQTSPAVVLIVTEQGLGSGSLLSGKGDILTNWHVVGDNPVVGVVFKPRQEGQKISSADVRPAKVIRFDEVADLAIVHVSSVPDGLTPIALGNSAEIVVGADVHAIGHPTGEAWTYTMGVISQVRRSYKWTSEDRREHEASVIQTQTPINPGNSGGPLLTDDGRLIGVNSFKAQGEGLNFAVALDEVTRFLSSTSTTRFASATAANPPAVASAKCDAKVIYQGMRKTEGYEVTGVDLDCDGRADVEFRMPIQKSKPLMAAFDTNADGKVDVLVFSYKRDWKWNFSFLDTDFDGEWDLVGYHETGEMTATRYEPYSVWKARK